MQIEGPAMADIIAGGIMVSAHNFVRRSWWHRHECKRCMLHRGNHPTDQLPWWAPARPV